MLLHATTVSYRHTEGENTHTHIDTHANKVTSSWKWATQTVGEASVQTEMDRSQALHDEIAAPPLKKKGKIKLLPLSDLQTVTRHIPRSGFPGIPTVDKLNKDDDKFYVGPSDRIGRNLSPAVQGLSRRGRKHAISPPRSPHLDHIVNPPVKRRSRVLNFSAGYTTSSGLCSTL